MTVEFCPFEDLEAVLSENATAADLCGTVVIEYSNSYGSFTGALGNFTVTRTLPRLTTLETPVKLYRS